MARAAAIGLALLLWPGPSLAGKTPEAPTSIEVSGGPFIAGSDREEREFGYILDEEAYGHTRTRERGWYDRERPFGTLEIAAFRITETLVTNRQYADFVAATGHRAPDVDRLTWESFGLIHPYESTRRFAWTDGKPPEGREEHPVVLVSHSDALAYAAWLSEATSRSWRLPSELEWEKAARGTDGRRFPWGNLWDPALLNSADEGPFDTVPVGSFPKGASPYGLLDMAGQVFEWTATESGPERYLVKGGSWDDKGCGVCRAAARHGRPASIRHILIGFRLITE